MAYSLPGSKVLFADATSPRELSERKDELVEAMTKATAEGIMGATTWGTKDEYMPIPNVVRDNSRANEVAKAIDNLGMAKMAKGSGESFESLAKEWTLTNPLGTGLVPYDLNLGVAA